jgi:hypothetical protein
MPPRLTCNNIPQQPSTLLNQRPENNIQQPGVRLIYRNQSIMHSQRRVRKYVSLFGSKFT